MNANNEHKRIARLPVVLVVTLVCLSAWAAAEGPVANFPLFTPLGPGKVEGVAVDKVGDVYVSIVEGEHVRILKFSPAGDQSIFADMGKGESNGLAVDARGDVYAAVAVGAGRGVYRVSRDGNAALLPGTEKIVFANALAFDQRGNLFVTESYSITAGGYGQGGIWRIPPGGEAELWLRDELMTGTGVLGYPVGANGIAFYHGDLYVVNCDKGLIVRIPVHVDGSPGLPDVWATLQEVPESLLAGPSFPVLGDGLALDVHGNVYVASPSRLAIVRISAEDLTQETIATFNFDPTAPLYAPLDTPASLAFGTGKGGRTNLFVTNLGWMTTFSPGAPWPGSGLVMIEAGVPGLPLP
jgi:sugar lactone lactonase YvrE